MPAPTAAAQTPTSHQDDVEDGGNDTFPSCQLLQDLAPGGVIYEAHAHALSLLYQGQYPAASIALDEVLKQHDLQGSPLEEEQDWLVPAVALELLPSVTDFVSNSSTMTPTAATTSSSLPSSCSSWTVFRKAFVWNGVHPGILLILENEEDSDSEDDSHHNNTMTLLDLHELVSCVIFYNLALSIHLMALSDSDEQHDTSRSNKNKKSLDKSSAVSIHENLLNQALGTYGMPLTDYSQCLEDHPTPYHKKAPCSLSEPCQKKRRLSSRSLCTTRAFRGSRSGATSSRSPTTLVSTRLLEVALWNNCAHIHAYFWSRAELQQCRDHIREGLPLLTRSERRAAHPCIRNVLHANLHGPSAAA